MTKTQSTSEPMTDDRKRALRNAFGAFPTGVTVVTTRQKDGTPRGFTANSFTSVSLDPPMLLICIGKTAHSCEVFTNANHFTVNVLSEDQKEVSGLFASRQADKFEQADWYNGEENIPLITGAIASFVCAQEKVVDAGDHIILIGEVKHYHTNEGAPLGYHAGAYFSVGTEDRLVKAAARAGNMHIGAILQQGQNILLNKSSDSTLSVPHAPEGTSSHAGLLADLAKQGLITAPQTLYAVYEDTVTGHVGVYYHGAVSGEITRSTELVPINAIPFERIGNAAERSMLERYALEFRHGSFGIYQGTQEVGMVHQLAPVQI